jgi:hypothetical protein
MSRWSDRREKEIIGDLAEDPLSVVDDIAEHLRRRPRRVQADLDRLERQHRVVRRVLDVPNAFGRIVPRTCWCRPDFDTELDTLTADQPDKERP